MDWKELVKQFGIGIVLGIAVLAKPLIAILTKKSKILWANKKLISQQAIYRIISDIRARVNADRVAIYEFTNGENSLNNVPFIFASMTYENTASHITSIKRDRQKFPSSWFAPIYAPLVSKDNESCIWNNDGAYYIKGIKCMDNNGGAILQSEGMRSQLIIKFTINIGDGILVVTNYNSDISLDEDEFKVLMGNVRQIWYHLKLKR